MEASSGIVGRYGYKVKSGADMADRNTGCNRLPSEVEKAELEAIRKRRCTYDLSNDSLDDRLVGLALSGGGIRSATFALGVLQRLAKGDLLRCFDYLSTVSGGGYMGGSLTWLLSQSKQREAIGKKFPYGDLKPQRGEDESDVLRHLRLHGEYLTPGRGITAMSLAAVVLRGIVLSLVVWLPFAVLFFYGLEFLTGMLGSQLNSSAKSSGGVVGRCLKILAELVRGEAGEYLAALAAVGAVFLLISLLYSLCTRCPKLSQPYRWRRLFERHVRWLLWIGLALVALASLPLVSNKLNGMEGYAAVATYLVGISGGFRAFRQSGEGRVAKIPVKILAPAAAFLVLYGMALASYDLAMWCLKADSSCARWLLGGSIVVSFLTGWRVNLNYISIHRYYRDRLMEAYMPSLSSDDTTKAAFAADKAEMSKMSIENGPYHLVNTNLVLTGSADQRWSVRGGDSFVLSPCYCGGTATGWEPTANYMKRDALTLPTAIAISGAAVNPNTGFGGVGLMRERGLSLLMALLNLRLGYWVPRPLAKCRQKVAHHFRAAYHELSPSGYSEKQNLLQLSDGGHFENLGVYELVRRRVKVIVCCDASADPGFEFASLQLLIRRIATDFDARIEFDEEKQIERLLPREPDTATYPVGARFARQGYVRGSIIYPDKDGNKETKSTLILLKTTMIPKLSLTTRGYKAANRDFPDQTTADQFFDEEQFEAYRELGYKLTDKMIEDKEVKLEALLKRYTSTSGEGA